MRGCLRNSLVTNSRMSSDCPEEIHACTSTSLNRMTKVYLGLLEASTVCDISAAVPRHCE
jgi:hypothetical protein